MAASAGEQQEVETIGGKNEPGLGTVSFILLPSLITVFEVTPCK